MVAADIDFQLYVIKNRASQQLSVNLFQVGEEGVIGSLVLHSAYAALKLLFNLLVLYFYSAKKYLNVKAVLFLTFLEPTSLNVLLKNHMFLNDFVHPLLCKLLYFLKTSKM